MSFAAHLSRGPEAQTLWLSEVVEVAQRTAEAINRKGGYRLIVELDEALLVPPLSMRAYPWSAVPQDTLSALYDHHLAELCLRASPAGPNGMGRLTAPTRGERIAAILMLAGVGLRHLDNALGETVEAAEAVRRREMPETFGVPSHYADSQVGRMCLSLREPSAAHLSFTAASSSQSRVELDPLSYITRRIEVWQRRMEHSSALAWDTLGVYALPPHMLYDPLGNVRQRTHTDHVWELRQRTASFSVNGEQVSGPAPSEALTTYEAVEAVRFILRCFCFDAPADLLAQNDYEALCEEVYLRMFVKAQTSDAKLPGMMLRDVEAMIDQVALRLRARPA